jgi:hypothetical protein
MPTGSEAEFVVRGTRARVPLFPTGSSEFKLVSESFEEFRAVPRLYSFDRMRVYQNVIENKINEKLPKNYLHELGSNLSWIVLAFPDVRDIVNKILKYVADARILPSTVGISIESDEIVIHPILASDTVLRLAYYLTALYSNARASSDITPVVMIEEPEAHFSPMSFDDIVKLVDELKEKVVLLFSTHSPDLLSKLFWEVKDTKIFYVYKEGGESKICEFLFEEYPGSSVDLIEEKAEVKEYCKR